MKDIVVLGGPNGAGKTTAASRLLPQSLGIREFVNADEIARGLSPFNPDGAAVAAGRAMLQRMSELAQAGESFAFETTCAGVSHRRFLEASKSNGYRLGLLFLWLPSADYALRRVRRRIRAGGHSIPETIVRRRYENGLRNMSRLYLPIVDYAVIFDNSDGAGQPVAEKMTNGQFVVHNPMRWDDIERVTR